MQNSIERAKDWLRYDPHEKTKKYVNALLDTLDDSKDSKAELEALFPSDGSRIGFGTAGLRSAMKPGPLGMNDLVIIQTTQGLATYCQKEAATDNQAGKSSKDEKLLAVIGYDHRAKPDLDLSSKNFALLARAVFLEAGFECVLLDGYVATPIVAYAITRLNAAVGIMVTASHNPKDDAGFKVYWNDGCQIRSPIDGYIAKSITEKENLCPWIDYNQRMQQETTGNTDVTDSIIKDYYQAVASSGLVTGQSKKLLHRPKICYTAMHGVGYLFALKVFQTFNFDEFYSVPEQQEPDHTFRTVPFPNPEENGALSLAMEYAEKEGCDIILANDPDADRLAVAERCSGSGRWTVFTGDQIGTMLGAWIWETIGKHCGKPVAMCASTVSSKMLSVIAQVEGFHFEDTLTGFKWIGSRLVQLRKEGYRSLFGYEEAIGFCCGDVVADKDGLSALGTMSELIFNTYGNGKTLSQHIQSLYDKYGEFCSNNGYFFCYEPATFDKIFNDIRHNGDYISNVGPYEVESIRDLGFPGYDSTTTDKRPTLPVSKSSPMITICFKNGTVAQFRGSGTEPKFKYYIEMRGKPGVARDVVEKDLQQMSDYIIEELLQPTKNGLKRSM
mmetsp:Transcript_16920/g.32040  ORF Transcript_16920/g.32040 Transcript_16920/m.32040 type:complete len:613 (-) Transcript_16920:87-1925(-)|eukprot:CAMPEP_0176495678 /NCGR_PEP_ID=MMETSP0200_2-20121128/10789_1 /TAXON_ID=947934 /ORGANISM="Chaetoceros sp., Strain GSL56" /LENGTH=612 /DNA_ID=CAMNT_0017893581 /DNA_START=2180 /DNA_END=4018 /DNA_ORIENTATION=-